VSDLRRLAPADARALLALAGTSLQAKREIAGPIQMIVIDGPEITDETIQATAHRILVEKRRALGIMAPVDLTNLIEGGRAIG
jgi:hypothetical protein